MSYSPSIGVKRLDSPGLIFTASVVSRNLEKMVEGTSRKEWIIPHNVRLAAVDFFDVALEATHDRTPKNPSASIYNYSIASEIMRDIGLPTDTKTQIDSRLHQYHRLLSELGTHEKPISLDLIKAQELVLFFKEVAKRGKEEQYAKFMGHPIQPK